MTGTDFILVTIIAKHLLAHVSLQRTQLNYIQISPGHIRTTLYILINLYLQLCYF
jgi:hypothetical protein